MPKPKYTRCSSCLRHIDFSAGADCPFCGEAMVVGNGTIGSGVLKTLRNSRASVLALGLAGGLSFSACGTDDDKDPAKEPDSGMVDPGNDYGGFDPGDVGGFDPDVSSEDAGTDSSSDASSGDAATDDASSDTSDSGADGNG